MARLLEQPERLLTAVQKAAHQLLDLHGRVLGAVALGLRGARPVLLLVCPVILPSLALKQEELARIGHLGGADGGASTQRLEARNGVGGWAGGGMTGSSLKLAPSTKVVAAAAAVSKGCGPRGTLSTKRCPKRCGLQVVKPPE